MPFLVVLLSEQDNNISKGRLGKRGRDGGGVGGLQIAARHVLEETSRVFVGAPTTTPTSTPPPPPLVGNNGVLVILLLVVCCCPR